LKKKLKDNSTDDYPISDVDLEEWRNSNARRSKFMKPKWINGAWNDFVLEEISSFITVETDISSPINI